MNETKTTVDGQAGALRAEIATKLGDLADELLGRPAWGSPEWIEATKALDGDKKASRAWLREWHLTKIRISRAAEIDPTGDVLNARKNGATWADIGDAWGVSMQRAHEKWKDAAKVAGTLYPDKLK